MEVQHVDGAEGGKCFKWVRLHYPEKCPKGISTKLWKQFEHPIDAFLYHISQVLDIKIMFLGTRVALTAELAQAVDNLSSAAVSRLRTGETPRIPEIWVLKAHQYTGIPLADLYAIAGYEPSQKPHKVAVANAKALEVANRIKDLKVEAFSMLESLNRMANSSSAELKDQIREIVQATHASIDLAETQASLTINRK